MQELLSAVATTFSYVAPWLDVRTQFAEEAPGEKNLPQRKCAAFDCVRHVLTGTLWQDESVISWTSGTPAWTT